jgi:PhoH-like ATPase
MTQTPCTGSGANHITPADENGRKTFVLDTNVLLHSAGSLFAFKDNRVVLAPTVLEELDRFKRDTGELGRNARSAIRALDALREHGRLGEGVQMKNGGVLQVVVDADIASTLSPFGLDPKVPDNQILGVALALTREQEKVAKRDRKKTPAADPEVRSRVIFVSKDINARVKADALGLNVMDFEQQTVDVDTLYTGHRDVLTSAVEIDRFYDEKELPLPTEPAKRNPPFMPNEFVLLKDETDPKHTALARLDLPKGKFRLLTADFDRAWNIAPRSAQQRMSLELLLDDRVQLVTLVGRAGTGKTLLALAAGLQQVLRVKRYEKIIVSRPIVPLGRDIGYLPGDKDEKLSAWMGPIFDNLKYLCHGQNLNRGTTVLTPEKLIDQDFLELEALTYIRGRSIADVFMIVDEAQNLTPHEIKTIISRVGENTKLILTGDPNQIDNPYLDAGSNGLTYCVERLKNSPLHGHVTLAKAERSPLAELAAERL